MHIDHKHKRWALATLTGAAAALIAFEWDAGRQLNGPRGSTAVGLTLGTIALALMIFCAFR